MKPNKQKIKQPDRRWKIAIGHSQAVEDGTDLTDEQLSQLSNRWTE